MTLAFGLIIGFIWNSTAAAGCRRGHKHGAMSSLDAAVVRRLAEIVHALRSGQPLEIAGDDVDQAVAKLIAKRWHDAEAASVQRRPQVPAGSKRVRGWVKGERVDTAIPEEVLEQAEVIDDVD